MNKQVESQNYEFIFHETRFPIVRKQLDEVHQKKFDLLSNEDKALFINILIKEGYLAW